MSLSDVSFTLGQCPAPNPAVNNGASVCMDGASAVVMFTVMIFLFTLGYGVGQLVLWTRRLAEVA